MMSLIERNQSLLTIASTVMKRATGSSAGNPSPILKVTLVMLLF
jgi:hypothetical protein